MTRPADPPPSVRAALRRLSVLKDRFEPGITREKVTLLRTLDRRSLATARQVRALHEVLCFWRAYPDSPRLLSLVDRMLTRFARRPDLIRHRRALLNSGMAGTDIVYAFGRLTATWLAGKWDERLTIEWADLEDADKLSRVLILFALPAEVPGLDEAPLAARPWLAHLKKPHSTDGAALVRLVNGGTLDEPVRDRLYEELGISCRLHAGPDGPSRTRARFQDAPVVFQKTALARHRPDLRAEVQRAPVAIRPVSRSQAMELIDLAREAMVTRERDLDAFVWADPRDVRLAECGDGLQFACIGVVPDRRFLLESVYGVLTLKNGVPVGYALMSGLLRFSEIAYNVFETFRGAEAAHIYGRLLATARAFFGANAFTIHPYQLGDGNDEGLESGAWWFYYKLGFRPKSSAALKLVRKELNRLARTPGYRTPLETLRRLVPHRLYFHVPIAGEAPGVGPLRLDRIGLAVTQHVTSRAAGDRDAAADLCADRIAELTEAGNWRRFPRAQRMAWTRWAPLADMVEGVEAWPRDERRALGRVILAKGGPRETDFVRAFDAHDRLKAAIVAISRDRAR